MRLRKGFALMIIAGVLGFQLRVILPRGGGTDWFWPFINYPMYSAAHYAGEAVRPRELRIVPCEPGRPARPVDWHLLRIPKFRYRAVVRTLVSDGPRTLSMPDTAVVARLSRLIREHVPGNYCTAELWGRTFVLPLSAASLDPPWHRIKSWRLATEPAETTGRAP
ncbi:MAG TPA: hypothetical protein VF188_05455 [Longimicrobiales bacterium]